MHQIGLQDNNCHTSLFHAFQLLGTAEKGATKEGDICRHTPHDCTRASNVSRLASDYLPVSTKGSEPAAQGLRGPESDVGANQSGWTRWSAEGRK